MLLDILNTPIEADKQVDLLEINGLCLRLHSAVINQIAKEEELIRKLEEVDMELQKARLKCRQLTDECQRLKKQQTEMAGQFKDLSQDIQQPLLELEDILEKYHGPSGN